MFYLGTHEPTWLKRSDVRVPLFISRRRLSRVVNLYRSTHRWALDSGGFTELSKFGQWTISPKDYAGMVDRYATEVGRMDWAAPMDYMCEPYIVAKTGLSIQEHQDRTIRSVETLRDKCKKAHIIPVLQGWTLGDYLRHADAYQDAGFDLRSERVVGIGSVCRRQALEEAEGIMRAIASLGIKTHGFGVKGQALRKYGDAIISADSMAWSYGGRRQPDPKCEKKSCANCLHFALDWRRKAIQGTEH